jgi:hypothetical protein
MALIQHLAALQAQAVVVVALVKQVWAATLVLVQVAVLAAVRVLTVTAKWLQVQQEHQAKEIWVVEAPLQV